MLHRYGINPSSCSSSRQRRYNLLARCRRRRCSQRQRVACLRGLWGQFWLECSFRKLWRFRIQNGPPGVPRRLPARDIPPVKVDLRKLDENPAHPTGQDSPRNLVWQYRLRMFECKNAKLYEKPLSKGKERERERDRGYRGKQGVPGFRKVWRFHFQPGYNPVAVSRGRCEGGAGRHGGAGGPAARLLRW